MRRALLLTLLLASLSVCSAHATELEEAVGMEDFRRTAEAYLEGYIHVDDLSGEDLAAGAGAILEQSGGEIRFALKQAGRSGVLLLAVAMMCALAETLRSELGGGGLDPARLAGTAAVTAIAAADVTSLMGLGREALTQMDSFSKLLLPTVTAACAAAGAPAAAVARQGAALLFFGLLLTIAERFFLPMVYAYTAVTAAKAALGNEGLGRVAELIKWAATGLLTLLLTAFVLYLSVSGAVGGNADALTQKLAKTALSGMVPVVGGILSDAAGTVVAGAGVLKGTVGVVGLLTVLVICLVPFLRLGAHYLVYKCAAALAAVVTPGPVASLIDSIGSAFALVLGMTGGGGLILYVALITSIKAVSG